jgi:chaperone modulatory protein CbpM
MTLKRQEFLARAELSQETLELWIKEEWLIPAEDSAELAFSEMDVARARLIVDLMHELGVNREGVGIILNLLDQMHGMRRALRGVLETSSPPADPRSASMPGRSLPDGFT